MEGSALAKSQRSSHSIQEEEASSLLLAGPCMEDAPFCLVSPREDGQSNSSPKLWRESEFAAESDTGQLGGPARVEAPCRAFPPF